jgi:hypothetical protein
MASGPFFELWLLKVIWGAIESVTMEIHGSPAYRFRLGVTTEQLAEIFWRGAADLPPGPFSPNDPRIAVVDWVNVDDNGNLVITHDGWTADADNVTLLSELSAEAEASRDSGKLYYPHGAFGPEQALGTSGPQYPASLHA